MLKHYNFGDYKFALHFIFRRHFQGIWLEKTIYLKEISEPVFF